MAYNKVVFGGNTLIDLTNDTVSADKLAEGYTAHDKSGALITGTMQTQGTILYTNSTGNNGNVSLSQSVTNFSYIEIEFKSNYDTVTYTTGRFYSPNGKNIQRVFTGEVGDYAQLGYVAYSCSGATLTHLGEMYLNHSVPSGLGWQSNSSSNRIHSITKVIGWK